MGTGSYLHIIQKQSSGVLKTLATFELGKTRGFGSHIFDKEPSIKSIYRRFETRNTQDMKETDLEGAMKYLHILIIELNSVGEFYTAILLFLSLLKKIKGKIVVLYEEC